MNLVTGDAHEVLATLPSASFDAMLTDPPYGIRFMGNGWDYDIPTVSVWIEALRVLKPGAFAFVACGTRTQHRMTVNLEDAGFEVRDIVAWVHASGFPKSSDISRGLDKLVGAEREVTGVGAGRSGKALNGEGVYIGNDAGWKGEFSVTRPASPLAERWADYGTRLKPSMELWTLVRKPIAARTVPENVLAHDVGGLNIRESRIPFQDEADKAAKVRMYDPDGRWPSNVMHDGSEEVTSLFPEVRGGNASRFFYTPKASQRERGAGNTHNAVKPLALTTYLANLLKPPAGRDRSILVPFAGSGSEMLGARAAGWENVVGIEIEPEFVSIAEARFREET